LSENHTNSLPGSTEHCEEVLGTEY
jgi:hypothetical protein